MSVLSRFSILSVFAVCSRLTILTRCSWCAILSILSVVDGNLAALGKSDGISYLLDTLINWCDTYYIIIILKSCDNGLQSLDVAVHLTAHICKLLERLPCRDLELGAVSKSEDYITVSDFNVLEHRITILSVFAVSSRFSALSCCSVFACSFAQTSPCCTIVV